MTDPGYEIARYDGDRRALSKLFALADDSPAAIAAYRDRGQLLVARERERVIGLALVIPDRSARTAELKALAVDLANQGQGIGAALAAAAVDAARECGAELLTVSTATADIGNLRFYQRVGFRMARIERDTFTSAAGYPDDRLIDGIPLRDQVVFDRAL